MSVARPYAIAAFEYARDHAELPGWQQFLSSAAAIASDPDALRFVSNPGVRKHDILDFFLSCLTVLATHERKNFLRLLLEYNRLQALPQILNLYNDYWKSLQKISTIRFVSAAELSAEQKGLFEELLSDYTGQSVSLSFEVDPRLIGGAVLYIGDTAIDGSVRGKLRRMLQNLIE